MQANALNLDSPAIKMKTIVGGKFEFTYAECC